MFRFDPEKHEYFLADRRLESVTEIIAGAGLIDSRHFSEESRIRGTYVHRATEMVDKGTLDWTVLDSMLLPYCTAYQKFVEDLRPEIIHSEMPNYHPDYLYAGTLDRVVIFGKCAAVLDIKTGAPNPAVDLQLAAYRAMARPGVGKSFALYLRGDSTYRLVESKDHRRNLTTFLAALTVVRWKKEAA